MMQIKQFVWDVVDSNSWLIEEKSEGLLIDPVDNGELYSEIDRLESLTIVLTHCHFDHIIGLNKIRSIKPDCHVISTVLCSNYIGSPIKNTSNTANAFLAYYYHSEKTEITIEPFKCEPADKTFEYQMTYIWCGHRILLTAVHGHTEDGLIALMDDQILFTGDTLLPIPTVTRLRTGSSKRFWLEDMMMLKSLNSEMKVYPGHGKIGILKDMIDVNTIPDQYRDQAEKRMK